MVMAISDCQALQFGLQFHPESILTPLGDRLLRNFVAHESGQPAAPYGGRTRACISTCGNDPAMRL